MIQNILEKIQEWAFMLASPEKIVNQYGLITPHEIILYENTLYKVILVDINKESFSVKYILENIDEPTDKLIAHALIYQPDHIKYHKLYS